LERSPGVWRLRIETIDGGTGKRVHTYERVEGTADDAARRRFKILEQADEGSWVEPSKLTVGKFFDQWLERRLALGIVKRVTMEQYQSVIDAHIKPALGAVRAQRVTGQQLQDFYTMLLTKKGLAANTVLHIHASIIAPAFGDARKAKIIKVNPLDEV